MSRARCAVAALAIVMAAALPVAAQEPPEPQLLLADPQPRGGGVGGAANLDGAPGDELLLTTLSGGFRVVRTDGSVLWRHVATAWSRPTLIPDVTGDGRMDVAAQVGFPGDPGEVLVLDGATGETVWRDDAHSPYGPTRSGDLNGDGELDLVFPSVDGTIRVRAVFGPDFTTGWTTTLPGSMNAFWVFGESLDVGNLDADPALEVVFGTRQPSNAGGTIQVMDGSTGAIRWSADTGSVFGLYVIGGRVVADVWRTIPVGFRAELVAWPGVGGAPAWTLPLPAHLKASNMAVGDVDGDGTSELVLSTTSAQEGSALFGLDPSTTVVYAVGVADGRLHWASKVNRELVVLTSVPRAGGGVDIAYGTDAFLSSLSDEQVGLLSGLTGAPLWIHVRPAETPDDRISGLVVADADGDGQRELAYGAPEQKIVALNPADGSVELRRSFAGVWTAAALGEWAGEPGLVGGGADGLVQAIDADGGVRWQAAVGGLVGGVHPTGDSVLVAVLGADARVVSLDRATGAQRWSFATGVAANNQFTTRQQSFGDLDGDGMDDAVIAGSQNLRSTVVAVNGRTGALLWRSLSPVTPPGQQPVTTPGMATVVSVVGDDVFAFFRPLDGREQATPRLALLNGVGGAPLWTATSTRADNDAQVVRAGQRLVVAFGNRYVTARSLADGTEVWSKDLGSEHLLVPSGGGVAAIAKRTGLQKELTGTLFDAAGGETPIGDPGLPAPVAAGTVPGAGVALATREGVLVLDPDALAAGEIRADPQLRLLSYTNYNGDRFDVPSVTQVLGAEVGGRSYAAGLSDLGYLNGYGGEVPGVWLGRLVTPR